MTDPERDALLPRIADMRASRDLARDAAANAERAIAAVTAERDQARRALDAIRVTVEALTMPLLDDGDEVGAEGMPCGDPWGELQGWADDAGEQE